VRRPTTFILAVDYGTKRTGLAVADDELRLPTPLGTIETADRDRLAAEIAALVAREEVDLIVVGMPYNMNGSEGPMAEAARALADDLRARTDAEVALFDERLTSEAAERKLLGWDQLTKKRRKKRIDALAAMILLQSYLDTHPG